MQSHFVFYRAAGRHGVLACMLVALLFGRAIVLHGDDELPLTKGPYLQAPGAETMTIMWETLEPIPAQVWYGQGDNLDQRLDPSTVRKMVGKSRGKPDQVFYVYEATLRELQPSTRYAYQLEVEGKRTSVRHFTTFGTSPDKVRFIVYGDTRTQPEVHAALARHFKSHQPDFILHTGDLVARGQDYALWGREFFGPLASVIDEIPLLPALGNHEQDGANFLAYFHLPGNELWYSFEVGPVHVLVLDYHFPQADHPQFAFAEQDLQSTRAPWKVVMIHYPMFNLGGHATSWGHEAYLPLFHRQHVDLVVTGHSHIYERFRPLAPQGDPRAWPILHITSGGGGAPLYESVQHPALAAAAAINHFIVFDATPDSLTGRVFTKEGKVFDRFTLEKTEEARQPAAYLAEVYPEEWIALAKAFAGGLTGRLTGLPSVNDPAFALLTLVPPKDNPGGWQIEISLTEQSAQSYELVEAPARLELRNQQQNVWVKVKPKPGVRVKADSKKQLSPPLAFQARIKAGKIETVAVGNASRLSATAARMRRDMGAAE